tara:strand:- start:2502 stop:2873 length:372 start_codon:yes stop_codon:yes gene_type:complete
MSSQLNVDTIANKAGSGPVGLTKQTAAKVRSTSEADSSIVESFGVSSISDTATGIDTINYTNNFSAAKAQQPVAFTVPGTDVAERPRGSTITSGSMLIVNEEVDTSTDRDPDELFFTAHGDLA